MYTFTPPKDPVVNSSVTFNADVLQAEFGDGYEQTSSAGLNSVRGTYQASWDVLTEEQRDEIEDFLSARVGAEAFLYTFPGESTERKFKCRMWSRGHVGGLYTLRAELREVFDLA